jgi:hypothetical protein
MREHTIMEETFFMQSITRLYNKDQLPLSDSLETAVEEYKLDVRWSPACEEA